MIINYMSDLHLESGKLSWEVPDEAEVVVIAGDLWNGNSGLNWLEEIAQEIKQPIIYVPGNHCFWDNDLHMWPKAAKKFCDQIGVYFLYNESVEIKDTLFLGTTLWTDYAALGNQPLKMMQASGVMNDFKWIRSGAGDVSASEIYEEHRQALRWLDSELARYADKKTCVVTHHLPSKRSIDAQHKDSRFVPYYASELDEFVMSHQPDVWVHGHVHTTTEYFIDETLVVCNPRGHANKPPPYKNAEFVAEKLLEF